MSARKAFEDSLPLRITGCTGPRSPRHLPGAHTHTLRLVHNNIIKRNHFMQVLDVVSARARALIHRAHSDG